MVTVSNAAGCTGTASVTVTVTNLPNANAGLNETICAGESTSLTANGGTLYLWSNGTIGATTNVTPSVTTTYTVTVSAGAGCTATSQVTVIVAPNISITGIVTPTTCGQTNGSIATTTVGGSGNYTYAWGPNVSTTANANNLTAGNYRVTVTDASSGCTAWTQFAVTNSAGPSVTLTATAATCAGNDGGINVSMTGGA